MTQTTKPNLIVLAHSESWCSLIERNFRHAKLSWVLDPENLLTEASRLIGAAAIVEVSTPKIESLCTGLISGRNNSWRLGLFAVGPPALENCRTLLSIAGFAASFHSPTEAPELVRTISKHHATVKPATVSIESRVWSELPWPTAASDRQA